MTRTPAIDLLVNGHSTEQIMTADIDACIRDTLADLEHTNIQAWQRFKRIRRLIQRAGIHATHVLPMPRGFLWFCRQSGWHLRWSVQIQDTYGMIKVRLEHPETSFSLELADSFVIERGFTDRGSLLLKVIGKQGSCSREAKDFMKRFSAHQIRDVEDLIEQIERILHFFNKQTSNVIDLAKYRK